MFGGEKDGVVEVVVGGNIVVEVGVGVIEGVEDECGFVVEFDDVLKIVECFEWFIEFEECEFVV